MLASMTDTDGTSLARDQPLPATAYAVLGILSVNDEELTPGEIRVRADFAFRHFYWSPAVSHIRRELQRLLEMGMVEEREISIGQVRRSQVYQMTEKGQQALARWVSDSPPEETVVVKNSVSTRPHLRASRGQCRITSCVRCTLSRPISISCETPSSGSTRRASSKTTAGNGGRCGVAEQGEQL